MNRFQKNRHRRDDNHHAIAECFLALGCSVRDLSQCGDSGPDMEVGICGRDFGVEVKIPGKSLEDGQKDFQDTWRGARPVVVWTVEQATAWVNSVRRALMRELQPT